MSEPIASREPSPLRLLIIADDLTGANDTGVQFAKKGIPVYVNTGEANDLGRLAGVYQVVVVNTESRHLPGDEAAAKVRSVVASAQAAGITHLYKKIDSALRGNIGSEIEAMMRASGCRVLPFVPAFPKLGRTTRNGYHYLGGKPLHETAFGRDPLEPIDESFIPAIIRRQTSIPARVVTTALRPLDVAPHEAEVIYVFDAGCDAELRRIGQYLRDGGLLYATAGSAGLAEHMPEMLGLEQHPAKPITSGANMFVVSGSVNETSLRQLSHAAANGFVAVTLPPEALVAPYGWHHPGARRAIAAVTAHGAQHRDVILRSVERSEDVERCLQLGRERGLDARTVHLRIAENLGRIAGRALRRSPFRIVTVFGGDTLVAIVRALNWSGLLPRNEILPGVTVSTVAGREDELLLVTKAGGFGDEDALTRIKNFLRSMTI